MRPWETDKTQSNQFKNQSGIIYGTYQKMKRFLLIFILHSSFFIGYAESLGGHHSYVQDEELKGVLTYMKRTMMFNQSLPQEKVYLHFDNTGYFKGETIWFKGYVVRADNNRPTNKSAVLYVELVNPSGDVVETRKLPVENGEAYGDIKLDSIYGSGFYEVRAYTRYMTNWGSGGIFSRVFPVFNAPKTEGDYSKMVIDSHTYIKRLPNLRNKEEEGEEKDGSLRVRFFPEGGDLVEGVNCRVAYVITDKTGAMIDVGGALMDENKNILSATNTIREGRGVFEITPDGRPKYLRLADSKGRQHDFRLPEAKKDGLSMVMNTINDEISVLLSATPSMEGRILGYTLIHNGVVVKADTMLTSRAMSLSFDRSSLPAGVNQLTFFTSDGHIQSERLFFICPESSQEDSITITSPTAYPKPCKTVKINIHTQPNAMLSLSAMDAATMVNGKYGNARTWLLLSSDIKGYIEDPGYYHHNHGGKDCYKVMMVQGWRRYDWKVMSGVLDDDEELSPFKYNQPVEDKLYLYGQLKQKRKKNTVDKVDMTVNLYNQSGQSLSGSARTDSLGNYAFSLPNVNGEWKMQINTKKDDKDANYYVGIDRHFSPARRLLSPNETKTIDLLKANLFNDDKSKKAASEDNEYIPIQKRDHVLPTVVVKAKRRIFEGARASWESETHGQHWATLYYNADEDADKFADQGLPTPSFYQWLNMRNPFFGGQDVNDALTASEVTVAYDESVAADMTETLGDIATAEGEATEESSEMEEHSNEYFESTDKQHRIYEDGLGYKNRPIVWILNNTYGAISHLGSVKSFSVFEVLDRCVLDMPVDLDEVKSVYVSEDPSAFDRYLYCPDLHGRRPVTVFVYTHHTLPYKVKGLRVTHFQGYNEPSVFKMEDYSYLPPMEDFRRTIFWAPKVHTDANGDAQVEFYNNSSCHEMHISCEGMTRDGRFLVNE